MRWARSGWRPAVQRELIVALLLLLCYGYFRQEPSWNEYSRYDLVLALVDDQSTRIDPYEVNTGDKAFFNGHFYSDKAPGSSLLGVPVYAAMRAVTALSGAGDPEPGRVMQALAFTVSGIPTVLLALLLLRFLRTLIDERWALLMSLAYGLGTIAFPFATMYFGHGASTFFLFAAFYLLWTAREGGSAWRLALAGSMAGWAVLTEFPVAVGVVIIFGYALWLGRRSALLFIAAGLPLLVVLLGYNWIAFEHPLRLGYQYTTSFAEPNSRGVVGVELPRLSTLLDLLLAPRGLLRLSPWLALTPLGLWAARRRMIGTEIVVCATVVVAFLAYNSGYFNPFGGRTPGPRYLTPALPFATILVALAPRAFRPLVALQVAFSVVVMWIATATMPSAPEGYHDPLGDLWAPRLMAGDLAETNAWLDLGLHGPTALVIPALAVALGLGALVATMMRGRAARGVSLALSGLLVALVASIGTPFNLLGALPSAAEAPRNSAAQAPRIAVVDAGATRIPTGEKRPNIAPWALLENHGGSLQHSVVAFAIVDEAGELAWEGWHGDVGWQEGERKRLGVEWSPKDAAPGTYWLRVTIKSPDGKLIYTTVEDPEPIQVYP